MGGGRLSSPIEDIQDHYTVVVVGSGYGGGIAASRLARAGQRVCVLERGKERQPGEFPRSFKEVVPELQVDKKGVHIDLHNGLFDLRSYDDISVLVGCGLGGTSLINANVSIEADDWVLDDKCWPAAILADRKTRLEDGYRRAFEMLRPHPMPDTITPDKTAAHEHSASEMGARWKRTSINVNFDSDGVNHVGVQQPRCSECGDCVTGCNTGAKNTTLMTYLPDAVNHGAEIFTEVEVRRVSREPDGTYAVHYHLLGAGREKFGAAEQSVSADLVILAAGTLGSTEILLRSQKAGLPTSDRIGHGFTGNGDVLGFGYNCDDRINGMGAGDRAIERDKDRLPIDGVGPCITSVIDLRTTRTPDDTIIEEGSVPGAIAGLLPGLMSLENQKLGVRKPQGLGTRLRKSARAVAGWFAGPHHGAMQYTQIYLVMGHEHSTGTMTLDDCDRLDLAWRDIGKDPIFEKINDRLIATSHALGGSFVRNPLWTKEFNNQLVTVHPLGGCVLADDASCGVVNHKGQVFSAATGDAVHAGLYVADGSVIPRSLGCNPLLTISALAERTCALIAEDHGWTIDYTLPSRPRPRPQVHTVGIEFSERMVGHFSTNVVGDFRAAEEDGRANNSPFEFVVTIIAEDLDKLITDDRYEAGMVGSARAPALSPDPLTVTAGRFTLMTRDPDRVDARAMRYRMKLTASDGRHFWFEGDKHIADDRGLDLWSDTTTLYVTVTEGEGPGGELVGRGVIHVEPADFLRQLRTTRAVNARGRAEQLAAVARFGAHFAGGLWDVYGGVFARPTAFDPAAPPRKKRPLHAPPPELHEFATNDGTALRLTRYRGGNKGPVMLVHGLGVSSLIFTIDTIETNLVEYLCAHGFDVWLLDFRSSIELPAHHQRYTADDVARLDFPAAVARVRDVTGATAIQVVAHCFGATTFTMAMLAGLQGVRSSVISQISTHISTPALTQVKTGLHIPEVLDALGVGSLTAYVDTHADWKDRLLDTALRLYPVGHDEHCRSKVCHRIALLYAPLYEHAQLDPATHDALHELFGDAAITAFEHLARLARTGHLVDATGGEIYMNNLTRLAIPTTFVHGAANACFLPRSTEDTLAALSQANGAGLYRRHLIPGYGHIDCIFGKHAARDVYPHILEHLATT